MKILVVGESPAKGYEHLPPILNGCKTGQTWERWCTALKINPLSCTYCNAKDTNGDPDTSFLEYISEDLSTTVVFALGRVAEKSVLKFARVRPAYLICLPHPSGLNRKLNNKEWLAQVLEIACANLQMYSSHIEWTQKFRLAENPAVIVDRITGAGSE